MGKGVESLEMSARILRTEETDRSLHTAECEEVNSFLQAHAHCLTPSTFERRVFEPLAPDACSRLGEVQALATQARMRESDGARAE